MNFALRRLLPGAFAICSLLPAPAGAQQQLNANLYAYFDWTGGPFGQNLDQEVIVEQEAEYSYWAMMWQLPNSNGGYLGLQTNGNRFDGSTGDTAIFSIWGAMKAEGAGCGAFGGEGTGLSCRLAYPIALNHWYRLRVWNVSTDKKSVWWGAWIMDETTQVESFLGKIQVAPDQSSMSDHANFSEYYGPPVATPNLVPRSIVLWSTPSADLDESGTYRFTGKFKSGTKADGTTGAVQGPEQVLTPGKRVQAVRVAQGG